MSRTARVFHLVANASTVDCSLTFDQRLALIADSGLQAVEFWWPFSGPAPTAREVLDFVAMLRRHELRLAGLNLFAGNQPLGDRGVLSIEGYQDAVRASARVLVEVSRETGCAMFNVLIGYGDLRQESIRERVLGRFEEIGAALDAVGGTILLEALTDDRRGYPLLTLDDCAELAAALADRGVPNVALLADTFHLTNNGLDVRDQIFRHRSRIAHVQVADCPGRGVPGTGGLPFADIFRALVEIGYAGLVSLETNCVSAAGELLDWRAEFGEFDFEPFA